MRYFLLTKHSTIGYGPARKRWLFSTEKRCKSFIEKMYMDKLSDIYSDSAVSYMKIRELWPNLEIWSKQFRIEELTINNHT